MTAKCFAAHTSEGNQVIAIKGFYAVATVKPSVTTSTTQMTQTARFSSSPTITPYINIYDLAFSANEPISAGTELTFNYVDNDKTDIIRRTVIIL